MIMWRMFTDLLCLMIRENHRIFKTDHLKDKDSMSLESNSKNIQIESVMTDEIISNY